MFSTIYNTHKIVVTLFLLIYLIKTFLLLFDKKDQLAKFTKTVKVPEMIVSFLFLATGIYMLTQIPSINTLMIVKIIVVLVSIPLAVIGFKKSNKTLAGLSLALIIGAYGIAEMSKAKKAKADVSVAATADGKELYSAYCTKCHGDAGNANIMGATDLSISQLDDNELLLMIQKGKGTMPAFESQGLSSEQFSAIANYVKTLRK